MAGRQELPIALSAIALSMVSLAMPARAASVTIGVDALPGNCFPFSCYAYVGNSNYQQAYNSEAFPNKPITIESFDIFNAFSGLLDTATFDVYFSTSLHPVGGLSTTFATNIGPDNTLFGTYSLRGLMLQSFISFPGSNAFTYDPSRGDLLMNVVRTAGTGDGMFEAFFRADSSNSGVFQRIYGNAPVAYGRDHWGLVTRFYYTPGPLPVVGVGAAFCFSRKLRKRIKTRSGMNLKRAGGGERQGGVLDS